MVYNTPVRSTSTTDKFGRTNSALGPDDDVLVSLLVSSSVGSHFFSPMPAMGATKSIRPPNACRAAWKAESCESQEAVSQAA
jgi:hypothetical protein